MGTLIRVTLNAQTPTGLCRVGNSHSKFFESWNIQLFLIFPNKTSFVHSCRGCAGPFKLHLMQQAIITAFLIGQYSPLVLKFDVGYCVLALRMPVQGATAPPSCVAPSTIEEVRHEVKLHVLSTS